MSGFIGGLGGGAVGDVLNLAGNLKLGAWAWGLQPASWRGCHFVVRASDIRRGRRVAVHEYVKRDEVWVEDLGRGTRTISFTAFIVGTDVYAQRDAMVKAAELAGVGDLVHPSLGTIKACLVEFSCGERADLGRVVELGFTFIEAPQPQAVKNFASQLKTIVSAVQSGLAAFEDVMGVIKTVGGLFVGGGSALGFVSNLFATANGLVGGFLTLASSVASDAALPLNAVKGLPGNNGRYALSGLTTLLPSTATAASQIAAVSTNRAALASAMATVAGVADLSLLPAALQIMTESVRCLAGAPRDQIRVLLVLAAYQPVAVQQAGSAPIGAALATLQAALAALCRRTALASLGRACAAYQPTSYDDAMAVLQAVLTELDAEITNAADLGDTKSFSALRATRAAIIEDLTRRGADLPRLVTVRRGAAVPSLTLAYDLYGDASRSDDLIARVDPPNPLFMPLSFRALSS